MGVRSQSQPLQHILNEKKPACVFFFLCFLCEFFFILSIYRICTLETVSVPRGCPAHGKNPSVMRHLYHDKDLDAFWDLWIFCWDVIVGQTLGHWHGLRVSLGPHSYETHRLPYFAPFRYRHSLFPCGVPAALDALWPRGDFFGWSSSILSRFERPMSNSLSGFVVKAWIYLALLCQ